MKKLLLLGSVLSLALVVLIISLLFKPNASQDNTVANLETEVASTVLLQPLAAEVSIFDNNLANWLVVDTETPVVDGAQIKTSSTGRALLTKDSDIVTSINSNTEMTLSLSADQKSNILRVLAGQTWTKITRALEQDEVYEVHTPTMVAAVRGTSFGVSTEPVSQITVTEGTVWASLIDPETGEIDPTTTVEVPAGKIVIYVDGALEVRDIEDKDKGEWYYEHNPETEDQTTADETDTETDTSETETESVVATNDEEEEEPEEETVVVLPNVTIGSVTPVDFDLTVEERLLIRGENLSLVERVVIDGLNREFSLTSVGVLVIEKTDLPTEEGQYDVTLFYRDTSVSQANAFSIIVSVPEAGIVISEVVAGVTNSPEDYVEVRGSGFTKVETLLVNGRSRDFQNIGDNMIHIFDYSIEDVETLELKGEDEEVTFTL